MENIKEKIQKLLNLATSDNEHEAALALSKATDLMNKWNLDVATVTGQKTELRVYEFDFALWTVELKTLAYDLNLIADTHHVYQNGSKKYNWPAKIHLSGKPRDIENFIYLFEFIRRKVEKESQKYKLSIRKSGSGNRNNIATQSFRIGFLERICEKLKGSKQNFFSDNKSLISIDSEVKRQEAKDWLLKCFEGEKIKDTSSTITISDRHIDAGKEVADTVDLNVAMNSGKGVSKISHNK